MNKFFIFSFFALFFLPQLQAQDIAANALGFRFGGNNGIGAEVSYQNALGENRRLEADLGWRDDKYAFAVKLTGIYQWVWALEDGFNWYAGVGAGLGTATYETDYGNPKFRGGNQFFVYGAGNIGIEYNFDIPLLASIDFRPEFGSGDYNDNLDLDIALSLRYQF